MREAPPAFPSPPRGGVRGGVCLSELADWEVEVGVGEGFVLQCEVPPLGGERLETVAHHGVAEQHTVAELFLRDGSLLRCLMDVILQARFAIRRGLKVEARELLCLGVSTKVGMALGAKPVERAAHVQLLLRLHVEEREVNRRASRVSALGTDIFPFEEDARNPFVA